MTIEKKYAVVAAGGVYPDADNLDQYWNNIINKVISIKEISNDFLHRETHFDTQSRHQSNKNDKSYTNLGAQVKEIKFNGLEFKIPPSTAKHMDDSQKVALIAVKEALSGGVLDSVDKKKVSVVMGSSGYGDLQFDFHRRFTIQRAKHFLGKDKYFKELSSDVQTQILSDLDNNILSDTFPVSEDSAPGVLPGILASRINSVFDFHGRALVVDTACASGLAAISIAMGMLDSGDSDAIICGAVDMTLRESGYILYSGINALSPDGSFPFDERANGFIIGQGGGVVVLKRLSDAIENGDTILSVVTAAGYATDGKGKAIAAPNSSWQAESIKNAYSKVSYSVDTVQYIEAHGTSTKVGDLSEVKALKESFKDLGVNAQNICGLSSVKSNIAHLKSAAGMAGFIKAVLAIKNKTLPPVAGFEKLNPELQLENSAFYVIDQAKPWQTNGHPRRAGVSAFGFGGVNYHIALEEYRAEDYRDITIQSTQNKSIYTSQKENITTNHIYLYKASANDAKTLADSIKETLQRTNVEEDFISIIADNNTIANASDSVRLSFFVKSIDDFKQNANAVIDAIENEKPLSHLELKGIYYSDNTPFKKEQIAYVFPGQGAQYAEMLKTVKSVFPSVQNTFLRADNIWKKQTNTTVSALIYSDSESTEDIENRLRQTVNTHPAIFTADYALFSLLNEMGLESEYCIGHSAGELVALTASGAFTFADGLRVMEARSKAFSHKSPTGKMVAIKGEGAYTQHLIDKSKIEVWVANMNSPKQTIVSGSADKIEKFAAFCQSEDVNAIPVNVSEAFHCPLVSDAANRFAEYLQSVKFKSLHTKVMSNETAQPYSIEPDKIRKQLSTQITSSVQFTEGIKAMYDFGVRLYVEVGPNAILGNNIKNILEGKDVSIVTTNFKKKDDLETIYRAFCQLFSLGIDLEEPAVNFESNGEIHTENIDQKSIGVNLSSTYTKSENQQQTTKRKVVYSGVSVGLPGTFKHAFREDNFEQLFQGNNFIERLTDQERQSIVDLQVRKLIKSEKGASYKDLDTLNDVIQFASKMGQVNFEKDFGYDPKELATMSSSIAHAVAAGYEALKDAHIPLVHQYTRTNTGAVLPEKWALPQYMQKRTGVIFANGFPMVEPVIEEVSRHLSYKLGNKVKKDIFEFYDTLISNIKDADSRKVLADWYAMNYSRLSDHPTQDEVYVFNHQFMNQISSQANNRLARYLNAQGPNFLILAACSSTATAITLCEEMIQSGRVDRMVIVSADDTANKNTLPYVGAGFLSTGAASNLNDLYEVAIPFDKRRNGMVVGSGAVGIVLEAEDECISRGLTPVAELVGTHCFNTAGHPSQLDIPVYADALDSFMTQMNREKGLERTQLASSLVYISHEPSTPPKGGCSQSEAVALQHVFGNDFRNIIVTNTKGMTGHTMGASIEDATAAKCLQYGKTPPVVNYKEKDPLLEGLRLSKGEVHSCEYALRMAAGFGSQGNYILLKKMADGDNRIFDENRFKQWLAEISQQSNPELEYLGKRLVVAEKDKGVLISQKPVIPCFHNIPTNNESTKKVKSTVLENVKSATESNNSDAKNDILHIVSEVSGYPVDMLELDMEFEADLGIDTVKQATILGMLSDRIGISADENFKISEYPTPKHLLQLVNSGSEVINNTTDSSIFIKEIDVDDNILNSDILKIVSEVSGYPVEMLEPDMEFEADLGIDTVKQATILGMLSEKYGISADQDFKIAEYPTPKHLLQLIGSSKVEEQQVNQTNTTANTADAKDAVLQIVSEVSGYPVEMLESDMEFEADLGIDTVKQATILGMLAEQHGVSTSEDFKISNYPTIGDLVKLIPLQKTTSTSTSSKTNNITVNKGVKVINEPIFSDNTISKYFGEYITNQEEYLYTELVELISNISDYAIEMLEEDSLWSELFGFNKSLDSQMKSAIIEKWNLPETFTISEDDTLQSISDKIEEILSGTEKALFNLIPGALSVQTISLQQIQSGKTVIDLSKQTALILADSEKIAKYYSNELKDSFAAITTLIQSSDYSAESLLQTYKESNADTIIDLGFMSNQELSVDASFDQRKSETDKALAFRFDLYSAMNSLEKKPSQILSLVAFDGSFGISEENSTSISPVFGLLSGLYKSLRKEWTDTRTAIYDVGISDKISKKQKSQILQELQENLPYVEVCIVAGKRMRIVIDDATDATLNAVNKITFNSSDTILVAGGGSGITAEWVKGMSKVNTTNFAIVGRTQLDNSVRVHKDKTETEWNAFKLELKDELIAAGQKFTPVSIEKEIARIKKILAIYDLIDQVKSNGCGIKYYTTDLQDSAQVNELIESIKKERSNITALVHGAGIEISHNLEQKSKDEFFTVLGSKVYSALALEQALKNEPLKRVFAFSSISGRFGNAAQLDYSAANDFLDAWVRTYNHKGISSLSINWSGWDKVGMAVRNSFVKEYSEKIGIHLIDPQDAVAVSVSAFADKSCNGNILIHKGIKPMHEQAFFNTDLSPYPFIDRLNIDNAKTSHSFRVFSPKRDLFLDQHRVRGISLMPGIAYMEGMIEHLSILSGKQLPVVFTDLQFLEGCKFHKEAARELSIETNKAEKGNSYEMRVFNYFKGKIAGLDREIDFCTANIKNGGFDKKFTKLKKWNVQGLEALPYSSVMTNSNEFINLGPLLNDMGREGRTEEENSYFYSNNAMVQYTWMPYEQLNNAEYPNDLFIANPCFMDTLHQAGAVFSLLREKEYHLPVGAEEFGIMNIGKSFTRYKTTVLFKKKEGDFIYHDILCEDEEGNACIYIKNSCYRKVRN